MKKDDIQDNSNRFFSDRAIYQVITRCVCILFRQNIALISFKSTVCNATK